MRGQYLTDASICGSSAPSEGNGPSEELRPAIIIDDTGSNSAVRGHRCPIDASIFQTEWPKRLYAINGIAERDTSKVPVSGAWR